MRRGPAVVRRSLAALAAAGLAVAFLPALPTVALDYTTTCDPKDTETIEGVEITNECQELNSYPDPEISQRFGDHKDKWVIVGGKNPTFRHTYPALISRHAPFATAKAATVEQHVGRYQVGPVGTSDVNSEPGTRAVARCRQVTWCDIVPLIIDESVKKPFSITLILSWDGEDLTDAAGKIITDPRNPVRTLRKNNLDFYIYEQITTVVVYEDGTEVTVRVDAANREVKRAVYRNVLGTRESVSALNLIGNTGSTPYHPEVIQLADLPATKAKRYCTTEYENPCTVKKSTKPPILGPAGTGEWDAVSDFPNRSPRCPDYVDVRQDVKYEDRDRNISVDTGYRIDERVKLIRSNPDLQKVFCPEIVQMYQYSDYLITPVNFAHDRPADTSPVAPVNEEYKRQTGRSLPDLQDRAPRVPSTYFENKGYKITAIYEPFVRTLRGGTGGGGYTYPGFGLPTGRGFGAFADEALAEAGLEPVKLPGPDGPLVDMELYALKGQTSEPPRQGRVPFVAVAGAFAGVVGVASLTFFLRRRLLGSPK